MADKGSTKDEASSSEEWRAWLDTLKPEELQQLRSYAWDRLLRARKVNVDGKQMSLRALLEEVNKQRKEYDAGLYNEDVRTIPRSQAQKLVPSRKLRPGSYKQMLRAEEQDALELQRMGNGNCFTERKILGLPVPPQRNFAYGIFARPDRVRATLGDAWAGKDPNKVLQDSKFYTDILRRCHQVEMTLMLLTSRALPLAEARPAVEGALSESMQRLRGGEPLAEEDRHALTKFIKLFDDQRLADCGWVEGGSIRAGTHIIVSATPQAGIAAEAITPGTLAERRTSLIGTSDHPLLTAAVFETFLGPKAVDRGARRDIAAGMLWAANGISFDLSSKGAQSVARVNQEGRPELGDGVQVETLPASTSIFSLFAGNEAPPRMLLNRISLQSA